MSQRPTRRLRTAESAILSMVLRGLLRAGRGCEVRLTVSGPQPYNAPSGPLEAAGCATLEKPNGIRHEGEEMKVKATVLGRIGYDLYAREEGVALKDVAHFTRYLGGSSANLAVGLSRLGVEVEMISCLGSDALCDYLVEYLGQEGVQTRLVERKEGLLASLCLCEVSPPDHFPQVFYRERAADTQVEVGSAEEEAIRSSQLFATNGTSLCASPAREATRRAMQWAKDAGVPVAFDVDYRDMSWESAQEAGSAVQDVLPWIDILIANELEVGLVAGTEDVSEAVARLRQLGVATVIAKLGSEGTRAAGGHESLFVPPFPIEVLSTIGAGDGFASGYLSAHLRGIPLADALRFGNAAAAIVVSRLMCAEAMPTREEVEALLHRYPQIRARPHRG